MIVYCNDEKCLHYKELKKKHVIKYHKAYIPLGEDEGFAGICTREEVGIEPRIIITQISKYKTMICRTRSDKKIAGHKDFTKLGPQYLDEDQVKEYERDRDRMIFNVTKDISANEVE